MNMNRVIEFLTIWASATEIWPPQLPHEVCLADIKVGTIRISNSEHSQTPRACIVPQQEYSGKLKAAFQHWEYPESKAIKSQDSTFPLNNNPVRHWAGFTNGRVPQVKPSLGLGRVGRQGSQLLQQPGLVARQQREPALLLLLGFCVARKEREPAPQLVLGLCKDERRPHQKRQSRLTDGRPVWVPRYGAVSEGRANPNKRMMHCKEL